MSEHAAPAGDRSDADFHAFLRLQQRAVLGSSMFAAGDVRATIRYVMRLLEELAALSSGETPAEPTPTHRADEDERKDATRRLTMRFIANRLDEIGARTSTPRSAALELEALAGQLRAAFAPPATEPGDAPSEDIDGLLWSFARYCVQTAISSERLADASSYEVQSAMLDELARTLVKRDAGRLRKAFAARASRAGGTAV